MAHRRLGDILVQLGSVTEIELDRALALQETEPYRSTLLGQILLDGGICTAEAVLTALGEQLSMTVLTRIPDTGIQPDAIQRIPASLALKRQLLPLRLAAGTLEIATADPFNAAGFREAHFVSRLPVRPVLAPASEIQRHAARFYMDQIMGGDPAAADADMVELLGDEPSEIGDLQRMAGDAVVIRWVNMLLRGAVQDRASDVHIEPFEKEIRVRNRVDGMLVEVPSPPKRLHSAIVSRVKIMAGLDIAEHRLPQDGRIKLRISGKDVDLRVSTMPTVFGETVALRILERTMMPIGLQELGVLEDDRIRLESLLNVPHGIILVTGPTGSGKTTTLYAALRKTYTSSRKIITIEDPVEYQLDGINQIQVRPKVGLTFASGLRHIVRQDPDIIMVGEIRDRETAEIAIHAALTGHLVFSTIHTNDSAGAIIRLIDMGVEPFLVSSAVVGVLAQRLVRRVCPRCALPAALSEGTEKVAGRRQAVGCEECLHTGYYGRTGLFELLLLNDELRVLIAQKAPESNLMETAVQSGTRTLLDDGLRKVELGITTLEEVIRVNRRDDINVTRREREVENGDSALVKDAPSDATPSGMGPRTREIVSPA